MACSNCITKLLTEGLKTCPSCKVLLTETHLIQNTKLQNMVAALQALEHTILGQNSDVTGIKHMFLALHSFALFRPSIYSHI